MHFSTRNVRIIVAVVVAMAMIGVAFWLTSSSTRYANALSTDDLLRAYVEQDSDADGLPDWQEQVYGTDPTDPESVEPGMTDAEAVREGLIQPAFVSEAPPEPVSEGNFQYPAPAADSLTERFSRQFFQEYFSAGGGVNVSDEEQQTILDNLLATFTNEAVTLVGSPYTLVSVRTDTGKSREEYVDALAEILVRNDVPAEAAYPLVLMEAVVERQDEGARDNFKLLAATYHAIAAELLLLGVPVELRDEHYSFLRSFDTLARASDLIVRYEDDPVAALGAISAFEPSSSEIMEAFQGIAESILEDGEPEEGSAAAMIVRIARSAEQP